MERHWSLEKILQKRTFLSIFNESIPANIVYNINQSNFTPYYQLGSEKLNHVYRKGERVQRINSYP